MTTPKLNGSSLSKFAMRVIVVMAGAIAALTGYIAKQHANYLSDSRAQNVEMTKAMYSVSDNLEELKVVNAGLNKATEGLTWTLGEAIKEMKKE